MAAFEPDSIPIGMYSAEGDPWQYRINSVGGNIVITAIKPDGEPVFLESGMSGKNGAAYDAIISAVKSGQLKRTAPTEIQTADADEQRQKYADRQAAKEMPQDSMSPASAALERVKEMGSSALESAKSGASRFADVVREKMSSMSEPEPSGMRKLSGMRPAMEASDLSELSPRERQYFIDAIKSQVSGEPGGDSEEIPEESLPPAARKRALVDTDGDGKPDSEIVAVPGRK